MSLDRRTAPSLGLALLAGLIAAHALTDSEPLTGTFVIAAFLAALGGTVRGVAAVGIAATLAAASAPLWSDAGATDGYLMRTGAVAIGSVFAAFAARQRVTVLDTRGELAAVLDNLADAVTVQDASGRLVYANDVAAELLGCTSASDLVATPPDQLIARFESFTEDGEPLDPDRLPGRRVLRGESPSPIVVRAINRATGEERWQLVKAAPVPPGPAGEPRAINLIEDITATKRAEIAQRLLADAGDALARSLDYEVTLGQVAQMAVPAFADWCSVSLPREDGVLDPVAVAHVDPERVRFAHEVRERYPQRIDAPELEGFLQARRAERIEISDEMLREAARDEEHYRLLAGLGLRSAIRVPMFAGDELLGVVSFVTGEAGRTLTEADVGVAEELARRASVAIQNAELFEERSRAAVTLENALRPPRLPAIPGWRAASFYEPASGGGQVGGDFYDSFRVGDEWTLMIGDVGGRGVEAAALTAMARYTLRTALAISGDPVIAFEQLNASLLAREPTAICTAALALLTPGGRVRLCSAGHPPPAVISDTDAAAWRAVGPMLGAFPDASWETAERAFAPGDQLALFTDGVFELPGPSGRFGEERLLETLSGVSDPGQAVRRVQDALADFAEGWYPDDMAVLVVQREAGAATDE